MADIVYRANLKAAKFPLLSELQGRTVIVRGQDQNYSQGLVPREQADSAAGIPQIYYCHNVIPTDLGYKSVGYQEVVPAYFPEGVGLTSPLILRTGTGESASLVSDSLGNLHVLETGTSVWLTPAGAPSPELVAGKRITVAFVSGVTYIFISRLGCYTYDWNSQEFSEVTLTGLDVSQIIGVAGNKGYLIAYSEDSIAWSSVITPTDFTPSLETGAGGGGIEGARGELVTIESVYGGMIVFTSANAVAAIASDNVRYPYNFVEVTGAGGLIDPEHVSYDANSGAVYAYTTSGLQTVSLRQALTIFPEVTEFISGEYLEDFDEVTNEFSITSVPGAVLAKKLAVVADRYLIISYGVNELTYAIYYDTALKQFGKLKVTHTACFELERTDREIPRRSIAFLNASGRVTALDSDIISDVSNGVMLLGKYQYVRSRRLTMQNVSFENVNAGDNFSLSVISSLDGKNDDLIKQGFLISSRGKQRSYNFFQTGLNHSILLKGAFHAVSLVLTFTVHGGR